MGNVQRVMSTFSSARDAMGSTIMRHRSSANSFFMDGFLLAMFFWKTVSFSSSAKFRIWKAKLNV